jgi:DNA uptake protein ComE-like DNA-binding protein
MTEERVRMLEKLVYADTSLVNPLRLNFADIPTLARHPYFTREQAQQIVNSRSARGPFEKSEDLLERQILDPVAFKKVRPYLTCR